MRWEDETYVRLFTRDTARWKRLPWQAKCLLPLILRKLDRAGIAEVDADDPIESVAAMVDMPVELVKEGLPPLLKQDVYRLHDGVLIMPNFMAAQEAAQSDKARKRTERERARARAVTKRDEVSQNVTECHAESRDVTRSHAASHDVTLSFTELSLAKLKESPPAGAPDRPTPVQAAQLLHEHGAPRLVLALDNRLTATGLSHAHESQLAHAIREKALTCEDLHKLGRWLNQPGVWTHLNAGISAQRLFQSFGEAVDLSRAWDGRPIAVGKSRAPPRAQNLTDPEQDKELSGLF